MSPGIFRKQFAFEKWTDFDQDLLDRIYNDDSQEKEFTHHIYGYDIDLKAITKARTNIKAAGFSKCITVEQKDFKDFEQPQELAIMITNPPYGERISTNNLFGTYKMIGERLKHAFQGNDAWILSYREECFEQLGLRPTLKVPLYNGSLECEFRKYRMFDGKMKEFRQEGNILKTEEEKKAMAEKHRFKKNREFKKRLDEEEANEKGDIRSFVFHKHNPSYEEDFLRRFRKKEVADRRDYRNEDSGNDHGARERKGKRSFNDRDRDKRNDKFQNKGSFKKGGKSFDRSDRGNRKGRNKNFNN